MRAVICALSAAIGIGCVPLSEGEPLVELTWDTPLAVDSLGFEPGPVLRGASLADVVSGRVDARGVGRSCTACHFDGSVTFYRPEIAPNELLEIGPYDVVDGRSWAGNLGWGAIFTGMGEGSFAEKPPALREAFALFLEQERERVEPLTWDAVMDATNLGVAPDPALDGKRLVDVINSRSSARPDGRMCADCHHAEANIAYRPAIARGDATTAFGPDDVLDGRTWAGPGGWAERFAASGPNAATHKPDFLRAMFFKWNDDGGR